METENSTSPSPKSALGYAIFGLFCLGFVFGPLAVLQGMKIRRSEKDGQGMALAAVIVGGVATLLGCAILIRIGWNIWAGKYPPGP